MQGFILNTQLVRDEDLIVTILTKDSIKRVYRFYGVRHSLINTGNLIEFELEQSYKVQIDRLKDVLLVSFDTMCNTKVMLDYHLFIKLLYKHFRDIDNIDDFYFNMLINLIEDLKYQNSKRAIIESYIKLLDHEGRLNKNLNCLICNQSIKNKTIGIGRSFIVYHLNCLNSYSSLSFDKINSFFNDKSAFMLDDNEILFLWDILKEGI
jgi:recombinational DNA repair protein (RecF pathway)